MDTERVFQQLSGISQAVQALSAHVEATQAAQAHNMAEEFKQMKSEIFSSLAVVAATGTQPQHSGVSDSGNMAKPLKEVQSIPNNIEGQLKDLQEQLLRGFSQMLQMQSSLSPPTPAAPPGALANRTMHIPPMVSTPASDGSILKQEQSEPAPNGMPDESLEQVVNVVDKRREEEEEDEEDEQEEEDHTQLMLREGNGLGAVFAADNGLQKPPYHVEDFYWDKGICQKIARSDFFANFTVGVVVINAVYIGFDSDYNDSQNIYEAHWIFQAFSQFFCVYFTGELVVRLYAFKRKRNAARDGWFCFDAFLVSTMILDTWLLMPSLLLIGGGLKIPTQPLRMLRLFKLTRMARLMKAFPELVTMIKGLVRSLRAISSTMILISLMLYVWAIMLHMLMKEELEFNDYIWGKYSLSFSTMVRCMWSLLIAGSLMLDNASPMMNLLIFSGKFNYIMAGIVFFIYLLISALCILQMLIGVLCDVVSTVKQEEIDSVAIGLMKQELLSYLNAFDQNGDGMISKAELKGVLGSARSRAVMRKLKINYPFLTHLLKGAFNKNACDIPISSVLEFMVLSRGQMTATVESMAGALVTLMNELSSVKKLVEKDIRASTHEIEDRLDYVVGTLSGHFGKRADRLGEKAVDSSVHPKGPKRTPSSAAEIVMM